MISERRKFLMLGGAGLLGGGSTYEVQPVTHISHSLHIGQPALQVAGKLKRDAGRGPCPQAHTHVEGQAYVYGLKLLSMHKPASNAPCGCAA